MLATALSFACLAEAVILFPASSFTFIKLYQGSKSNFAYLLIAFTFAFGLSKLVQFIFNIFPNQKVNQPYGYTLITNTYFYWLLSLQTWIFGMKYLWSGVLCSSEVTYLSLECVRWMGWTGGLCFSLFMITCWCILMATFPGWTNSQLLKWYANTLDPIGNLSSIVWGVFNTGSTIITILGIFQIMKTMQQLKKNNANIKTSYFQLTIHAFVLTLNLIPVIALCVPYDWLTHRQLIIFDIILLLTETISQLCICYICWNLGSSSFLRTHQATIVADSAGRLLLRFLPKDMNVSVLETLNDLQEEQEEYEGLERDSMVAFNRRGCDEIMFQFMQDLDSQFDIENQLQFEEFIEPNNHSGVNIETIEK